MALYDNKHWLLSHIRNSFITSDDSGMCEAVMICDNIAKQLPVNKYDCYPCVEQDEEEDDLDCMAQSFDLNSDLQFGLRRHRSNTAQRLEKMEEEKKKSANTIHVKWITNPVPLSAEEKGELFPRKPLKSIGDKSGGKQISLLTELLAKFPNVAENPFKDFAKMDGNAQVGVPTKKYSIFITMLNEDERRYPMEVVIVSSAKVIDLIGLICWKCSIDHPNVVLKDGVNHYGLFIAEDDGDVDWDFPSLDTREVVSKFGFDYLALVEREHAKNNDDSFPILIDSNLHQFDSAVSSTRAEMEAKFEEDMNKIKSHINAIKAPVYQSFNVYVLSRVRPRMEIHLGISGEKLEIFPVVQQRVSAKLWGRKQRAETFWMEDLVSCDLTQHKSNNRSTFRIVYCRKKEEGPCEDLGWFKQRDFESETTIATEIVKKVNNILEVRQSTRRNEYIALRERKSHRKKHFQPGPR